VTEGAVEVDVRLAELLAALSLGVDLGFGQPMEHVLRQCRIAKRLCELVEVDDDTRVASYYSALLVQVGCHTDAFEQARWFGDDIAVKSTKYDDPASKLAEAAKMIRMLGAGQAPLHRLRVAFEFALGGYKDVEGMIAEHARLAQALGAELELPPATLAALGASYERWDGKGYPGELAGEAIPLAARIVQLAEFIEVAHRNRGLDGAVEFASTGSGTQFDPHLVALVAVDGEKVFQDLDDGRSWDAVVDDDPALTRLTTTEFENALSAIARYVDLKSPYLIGHSQAVASLAASAAAALGAAADECALVHYAGLCAGFGRLGVSNAIWDKAGPLTVSEWERVRTTPQLGARMLAQSAVLAPVARVVALQRERLDGSGYPAALTANSIDRPARVLAVADSYQAMLEPRPHRAARTPADAADELRRDVHTGRFDRETVDAVLGAAGHRAPRRPASVAGLTSREVDVLRLAARGLSNKEIASRLVITPKTVGNHIEHIYVKIGATNRAGAALFAMRNGLLPEDGQVD